MGFWLSVVLTLSLSLNAVLGRRLGAPIEACDTITPNHGGDSSTDPLPYTVNISNIGDYYMPGRTYTIILSGGDMDPDFRGFLVQARTVADNTPVGEFMIGSSTDQQNQCMANTGVTHTNNTEKTMVELTWTAPPAGTGDILFRFAFVDTFPTYWANQTTSPISEGNFVFFNPAMYTVNEAAGIVQPVIYINTPLTSDFTIMVNSMHGTAMGGDYMSGPYSVIFPANMTYVTFNISITDDTMFEENNETFMLTITDSGLPSVMVGYPDQATVTIVDDDATYVTFEQPMYTVGEGDGEIRPVLVLSRSSSSVVIVCVYNMDGTATGDDDYAPGPYYITIPVNTRMAPFNISIFDDTEDENNENFMLTVNSTALPAGFFAGNPYEATVTITDNDAPPLAVMFNRSAYTVDENDGPVQPVVVLNRMSTDNITFQVYDTNETATGGGVDYVSGPYFVTIRAGQTYSTFDIEITNDNISEYNENFTININESSLPSDVSVGNTDQAIVTIVDDDTTFVMFSAEMYSVTEDQGPVSPELVLSEASLTGVTVYVYSMDGTATGGGVDYMSGPYSVTFPADTTRMEFDIAIINDTTYEAMQNFMIGINSTSLPDGFRASDPRRAMVTIMEDDPRPPSDSAGVVAAASSVMILLVISIITIAI